MPQDERRGEKEGAPDSAPNDPDSDPRAVTAEPPPQAPIGQIPAEAGGPAPAAPHAKAGKVRGETEVRAALQGAHAIVGQLETELAVILAESLRAGENDRVIAEYEAQYPDLQAEEAALELFRTAEITFLKKKLPAEIRGEIAKVGAGLRAKLRDLASKDDEAQAALEGQQRLLDNAKAADAAATAALDRLARPVEPVRTKLKDAEALRAAVNKAEESGDYALAFWLVMDGGRLQQRLNEEPALEPEALRKALEQAQQKQAEARAVVARAEPPIAALSAARDKAKADHEAAKSSFEERIVHDVSALNPKPAQSALGGKDHA